MWNNLFPYIRYKSSSAVNHCCGVVHCFAWKSLECVRHFYLKKRIASALLFPHYMMMDVLEAMCCREPCSCWDWRLDLSSWCSWLLLRSLMNTAFYILGYKVGGSPTLQSMSSVLLQVLLWAILLQTNRCSSVSRPCQISRFKIDKTYGNH